MKTVKRKAPQDGEHIVEWFCKQHDCNMSTTELKKLIKEAKEYEELRGLRFFRKGMEFQYHETNMNECK